MTATERDIAEIGRRARLHRPDPADWLEQLEVIGRHLNRVAARLATDPPDYAAAAASAAAARDAAASLHGQLTLAHLVCDEQPQLLIDRIREGLQEPTDV